MYDDGSAATTLRLLVNNDSCKEAFGESAGWVPVDTLLVLPF